MEVIRGDGLFHDLVDDMGKIEFYQGSIPKGYKYEAFVPQFVWNKWRPEDPIKTPYKRVVFGLPGYEQWRDLLNDWGSYNHHDEKRREEYKKRHEQIKLGDGRYSYRVPFTKGFFSYYILW